MAELKISIQRDTRKIRKKPYLVRYYGDFNPHTSKHGKRLNGLSSRRKTNSKPDYPEMSAISLSNNSVRSSSVSIKKNTPTEPSKTIRIRSPVCRPIFILQFLLNR
jgi:hypothetical protein